MKKRNTEAVILSVEIVLGNVRSSSTTHITIYPQHHILHLIDSSLTRSLTKEIKAMNAPVEES
jgi:hypothetical protein